MSTHYDSGSDTLHIILGAEPEEPYVYKTGDYTVIADERDVIRMIVIRHARAFLGQAIEAGVPLETEVGAPPHQSHMVWFGVDSSMISAVGYDEVRQVLELAFRRSGTYRYYDVPRQIVEELLNAPSKGQYVREHIIDQYPTEKHITRELRGE